MRYNKAKAIHMRFILLAMVIVPGIIFAKGAFAKVEEHKRVAEEFTIALNSLDYDTLNQLIDLPAYSRTVGEKIFDSQRDINGFSNAFAQNQRELNFAKQLFLAVESGATAKYRGDLGDGLTHRPLVRIDYHAGGMEYMLLHINEDNKVYDFFMLSKGKNSTQVVVETIQLTMAPGESFIQKILGQRQMDEEILSAFQKSYEFRIEGKLKEAYGALMTLPEELKQNRSIIDMAIQIATLFDDEEYKKQLQMLATYFGNDADTQFMLIDHYLYTGQYEQGQKAIDSLMKRFGEDGALLNLKGNFAFHAKDYTAATGLLRKAITVEPDYEEAWWSLLSLHIETKEYHSVTPLLKLMTENFGYEFAKENFEAEPFYSDFVLSDEFKNWEL